MLSEQVKRIPTIEKQINFRSEKWYSILLNDDDDDCSICQKQYVHTHAKSTRDFSISTMC